MKNKNFLLKSVLLITTVMSAVAMGAELAQDEISQQDKSNLLKNKFSITSNEDLAVTDEIITTEGNFHFKGGSLVESIRGDISIIAQGNIVLDGVVRAKNGTISI